MSEIVVTVVPVFSSLCNLAFALRRAVFVAEQGVPEEEEFDGHDLTATHWVAIAGGEVCGTLRVIEAAAYAKLGRIVVRLDRRGRGIARRLIEAAMDERRAAGRRHFQLDAQADKLGFYERFGFAAYGEEFDDGGIRHRAMRTR